MVPISKATYFSLFLTSWFLIFETSLSMAISRKSSCWILARRGTHDPDAALLNFVMKNQSRMVEKERDNEKEKPRKLHERYRWRTWCYGRKISFKGSPKPRYSRVAIALWHMTLSIFLTINMRRHTVCALLNRQIFELLSSNDRTICACFANDTFISSLLPLLYLNLHVSLNVSRM